MGGATATEAVIEAVVSSAADRRPPRGQRDQLLPEADEGSLALLPRLTSLNHNDFFPQRPLFQDLLARSAAQPYSIHAWRPPMPPWHAWSPAFSLGFPEPLAHTHKEPSSR